MTAIGLTGGFFVQCLNAKFDAGSTISKHSIQRIFKAPIRFGFYREPDGPRPRFFVAKHEVRQPASPVRFAHSVPRRFIVPNFIAGAGAVVEGGVNAGDKPVLVRRCASGESSALDDDFNFVRGVAVFLQLTKATANNAIRFVGEPNGAHGGGLKARITLWHADFRPTWAVDAFSVRARCRTAHDGDNRHPALGTHRLGSKQGTPTLAFGFIQHRQKVGIGGHEASAAGNLLLDAV